MAESVVDRLQAVGVGHQDVQLRAVGGGKAGDACSEDGTVGEAGERITAGGLQLAAYADVVGEDGQGEWHGGRGDGEGVGWWP
jgi:hypothetical protein